MEEEIQLFQSWYIRPCFTVGREPTGIKIKFFQSFKKHINGYSKIALNELYSNYLWYDLGKDDNHISKNETNVRIDMLIA